VVSGTGSPIAGEGARGEVEREGAERHLAGAELGAPGRLDGRLPAQHRLDARHQLARVERLGQVVVGAGLEAGDAVHVVALGGEHDDGDAIAGGAQPPADRQPVLAGQHEVEHHQVVAHARALAFHGRGVGHGVHGEALLAEVAPQQVAQPQVVVDHEDLLAGGVHGLHRSGRGRGCGGRLTSGYHCLYAAGAPRPLRTQAGGDAAGPPPQGAHHEESRNPRRHRARLGRPPWRSPHRTRTATTAAPCSSA
jgi:hypothetical protein